MYKITKLQSTGLKESTFWLQGKTELPHIIGLTASIVSENVNLSKFEQKIKEVELALDSKVITTTDLKNILKFVTQPEESFETFESPRDLQFIRNIVQMGLENLNLIKNAEISEIEKDEEFDRIGVKKQKKEAEDTVKKYNRY